MTTSLVQRLFSNSDVICVKCCGDLVFAGVSGILKIFNIKSRRCISEKEIFKNHRIHGFHLYGTTNGVIFGAKDVSIIAIVHHENEASINITASIELDDWILNVHWLCNGTEIGLITAHNVAWRLSWDESSIATVSCSKCSEKCILYSAVICGRDWEDSIVFSGTVFSEVVLWKLYGGKESDQPVLHRLKGHNGVIFSISWDWASSTLCTTSDDRSVRTWKVIFSHQNEWESASIALSHIFYGHSARVWKCLMLQDILVSSGEDSRICVWNTNGALLQKWERNASGCVWSFDYSNQHALLVAGSGDGSIRLFPLSLPQRGHTAACLTLPEHLLAPTDYIRKLSYLSLDSIVVVTECGTLMQYRFGYSNPWTIILKDERFANYCILSVSTDKTMIALASLNGHVIVLQEKELVSILDVKIKNGKIWAFLWLSSSEFLVCGDEGQISVWHIHQESGKYQALCIALFSLPHARERWPTAALIIEINQEKHLVCGDRCGSLHLFKFLETELNVYKAPCNSLFKLHGRLGVTSIVACGQEILSAGRDGTIRHLRVVNSAISPLSLDKMCMDWVALILLHPADNINSWLVGFKEKKMTFWCTSEHCAVLDLDCGGGHRSWDCLVHKNDKLEIAYVRDKHVHAGSWCLKSFMQQTLLQGMLAHEVNCVCLVSMSPLILAFGGEDGTVLVCQFSCDLSRVEFTRPLTSHISSIRCVCPQGNIFFSAGGRAQLKAWKLLDSDGTRESSCIELVSFMLKGDRNRRGNSAPGVPVVDPEMRFMSISSVRLKNDHLFLAAGCSDGALRFLVFNAVCNNVVVIGESMFHEKCLLKVSCITLKNERIVVLSAATDGKIALWNVSLDDETVTKMTREPLWSKRYHQSGVNCMHITVMEINDRPTFLIASGGDDNMLVLSVLQLKENIVSELDHWQTSSSHAAQITGVWIVDKWLISTSIDQRLTLWQYELSLCKSVRLNCNFVHQYLCYVADIQDIHLWQDGKNSYVCVVGKGVEILQLNLTDANAAACSKPSLD